ncbi:MULTISPECIES: WXG100 family type VII secretion target [unclassified Butyrivibrio]|uniref:WXG100 family type VII secretion target n=1 Tax=unclassified Butyrivibrio TaxID=2639466 RepID=UPI0003B40A4B|nr:MULTISPECIES: WXG100 family type VII secretion target [unclassified Butyrivibrio]MDC7292478.1 WXG100 family type VII secretion target [Butyrivibrio sp. DSM 10294]
MALNNLRVSDIQDLRAESQIFQDHADQVKNVATEMIELVLGTANIWKGEARESFVNKFEGLRDDIDRLYNICQTYSTDLQQIATEYENGENDNIALAQSLPADITML